jgi:glutaredoxin-like YruB-family protein
MNSTEAPVKIYSTTWCVYCRMVKEYLTKLGVAFKEIDIEQDQAAGQYIMGKSHSAGVPQIEIGDEVILGFDRPKIDAALKSQNLVR